MLAAGMGLGTLVSTHPNFGLALKIGGLIYVSWLIWKILSASELRMSVNAKPIGFVGAFALQWINPKAWAMALGVVSAFSAIAAAPNGTLTIAAIFFVLLIPATLLWSAFGAGMSRLLGRGLAFRIFNWTMAALIAASMAPVLLGS